MRCRIGQYACKDGNECIPSSHVCDGDPDCVDKSDEGDCAVECTSGSGMYRASRLGRHITGGHYNALVFFPPSFSLVFLEKTGGKNSNMAQGSKKARACPGNASGLFWKSV